MAKNRIRIAHGNGKNKQTLVQFVKAAKADSAACNEAQRLLKSLRGLGRRRVTVAGEDYRETKNRARSTCIVTKSNRENLGEFTRKVSERLPAFIRVAPDRVLVASFYAHPLATEMGFDGVAHFALHPDAGPKQLNGDDPDAPITREYREALVSTEKWMRAAREDNLLLILTGDLQVNKYNEKPWSPRALITEPLNLEYWATGIDWLIYDRRLELAGEPRLVELYDHTGFIADFQERHRKKK